MEAIASRLLPCSQRERAPFGTFGCHDGWAGTVSALAPDGFEAGVSAFDDHVVPTFGRERP